VARRMLTTPKKPEILKREKLAKKKRAKKSELKNLPTSIL
jgi:hypothetical protein